MLELIEHVPSASLLRRPRPGEMLWLCGKLPDLAAMRVAVVGSRKPQPAQAEMAAMLGAELARGGAIVISGGAEGIDIAALVGAAQANGQAVAVPGSGLDQPHPRQHLGHYQTLLDHGGALISPFAPLEPARQQHFLRRNSVMARMVDALIAVCADERSGTLHCVGQAWDAGLPVLAVPWSAGTVRSAGSNALLAAGARAIWDGEGCRTLLADLAAGRANTLLRRAERPPGRGARGPLRPVLPLLAHAQVIDATAGGRQCYSPEAVNAGAARVAPAGCDAAQVEGLTVALREALPFGLTIEELAETLEIDRGTVATLALQLVLAGWLQRAPGGLLTWHG